MWCFKFDKLFCITLNIIVKIIYLCILGYFPCFKILLCHMMTFGILLLVSCISLSISPKHPCKLIDLLFTSYQFMYLRCTSDSLAELWELRVCMTSSFQAKKHQAHPALSAVFLWCCPDCLSCSAHLNSTCWAAWAMWVAVNKYILTFRKIMQRPSISKLHGQLRQKYPRYLVDNNFIFVIV